MFFFFIYPEISEALSNSSLTPASSPKSNCDFDDGEMNDRKQK